MEGSQMKMREALKQALYFLRRHHMGAVYAPDGETLIYCEDVADIVDEALSAPPRQCDVGSAEDQAKRFEEFCNSHTCTTMDCKVRKSWSHFFQDCRLERVSCGLIFAQMPYEAERKGEGDGNGR